MSTTLPPQPWFRLRSVSFGASNASITVPDTGATTLSPYEPARSAPTLVAGSATVAPALRDCTPPKRLLTWPHLWPAAGHTSSVCTGALGAPVPPDAPLPPSLSASGEPDKRSRSQGEAFGGSR